MKKKKLVRLVTLCSIALVAVVMMLPTFFGSASIRKWLLNQVLAPQGIEAQIESVHVGWFRPTVVRGVSIGPIGKPPVLRASKIVSDRTLLSAIFEGVDIGVLTVVDPEIHIWIDSESSNLEFPLVDINSSTPNASLNTSELGPKTLNIHIAEAQLFVKTPAMSTEANVFSAARLSCTLRQDATGRTLLIEPGRIIDHATISPELCAGILKFVLPILSDATWTKGEFSIDLDACVVDLDGPRDSLVSGRLLVHGVKAGIKNEMLSAASERLSLLLGKEGFDSVVLADDGEVQFQVRDGLVWHDGVEFGLPKVSEDLVVRTSGSVSFDETLDLTVDIPMPLHLLANGPIAEALTDKTLTLHATGSLKKPIVRVADEDFIVNLVSRIGSQLADKERPLEGVAKGVRDAIRGDQAGKESATPVLDRIRDRMEQRNGPLRRLFGNGDE